MIAPQRRLHRDFWTFVAPALLLAAVVILLSSPRVGRTTPPTDEPAKKESPR